MKTHDLIRAIEVLRAHDETMPVQRVATLLIVALRGKITREEAAKEIGQGRASAYRNLMALTEGSFSINGVTKQGAGWLSVGPDEHEPRRLVWELSPKGRRLMQQIEAIR